MNNSKINKSSSKSVSSYVLNLKHNNANNNDQHSKKYTNNNNDKESSHENVTSTQSKVNNNIEMNNSTSILFNLIFQYHIS